MLDPFLDPVVAPLRRGLHVPHGSPAPARWMRWPGLTRLAPGVFACLALASACGKPETRPEPDLPELFGTLTVDGAPASLVRCRPGRAVHVYVEVDTSLGTLRFGEGKLFWNGTEQTCRKLDRSWGGGVRQDGSAYFRGTLSFRCGKLAGELRLRCGGVTPAEEAQLDANRAAARRPDAGVTGAVGSAPGSGAP